MVKRALTCLLIAGSLAGLLQAQQQNPADNKFCLVDYMNGIEFRLQDDFTRAFKIGKIFELGNLGKLYFQGLSPNEITLNYYNKNYSLEAVVDKEVRMNFEIKKDDVTFGVSSNRSVHLIYLNITGFKVADGILWLPYARFDIGIEGPKIAVGTIFNIKGALAPYIVFEKGEKTLCSLGIEFHTPRYMVALRGETSEDRKMARLDLAYKF